MDELEQLSNGAGNLQVLQQDFSDIVEHLSTPRGGFESEAAGAPIPRSHHAKSVKGRPNEASVSWMNSCEGSPPEN